MGSLKIEMAKGLFWSAVEKYSSLVVSFLVTVVLSRLISPSEFGVVSIATVIIQFLAMFTEMGIGPAIIQERDLSEKNLDSVFSFSLVLGLVLAVILFFASPFIASFYSNSKLQLISKILSINIFFAAANIVPNALILKNKRFKFIAKRTLFLQIISGIISVIYALNGGGAYALLVAPVLSSIGVFILNMKEYPRHIDWKFDLDPLKRIFSFSIYQFLSNFINYFSRNADNLIIGKYLGMSALGYYDKSYRLMMLPLQNVTNVVSPVLQPFLSDFQNAKNLIADKYIKIIKLIATISFPLGIGLFFIGDELIRLVYGPLWEKAVPTFRILSLSLPLQMILSTIGSIYQSANSTKWMFYSGLMNTCITVFGFIVSILVGGTIETFAWAWDITLAINFITSYLILYHIVLKSSLKRVALALVYPLINTVCISTILVLMNQLFLVHINYMLSLLVKISVCIISTIIIVQISGEYNLPLLWKKIRSRF